MGKIKINMLLTIGPNNDTGFRKHLEELSKIMLNYPSKFLLVEEKGHSRTLKLLRKLNPSLTIIGGRNWVKRNNIILEQIHGKKAILFCSPFAQAEISNEEIKNLQIYLDWLNKKRIDFLFVGSKVVYKMLNRKEVIYLPAPSISDFSIRKRKILPKMNIVAIFNDKAIHKNVINSVAGISLSKKIDEFWINGAKEEYLSLFNQFGMKNKMKNIGFIEKNNFYKTLIKIKLLLQLSFSEGFSYSTFEAMNLGVPVLVSDAIPWVRIKELKVKNIKNPNEISKKIDKILTLNKAKYRDLCERCTENARQAIKENNRICKNNLTKVLKI